MIRRALLASLSLAALAAAGPSFADCGDGHAVSNPMQDASVAPAPKQLVATQAPKADVKQDKREGVRGGAKSTTKKTENVAMAPSKPKDQ